MSHISKCVLLMNLLFILVYSSYSIYLAIQTCTSLASLLPINSLLGASIMRKLWLSCLIIQQLARGGNFNLAITTKVQLAQLGQQLPFFVSFLFQKNQLAIAIFLMYFKHFSFINGSYLRASYRNLRMIYRIYNFVWKT